MIRAAAFAGALMVALGAGAARADIECEYMSFQMSDVDDEAQVSICECGRYSAEGETIRVLAQRLICTRGGWRSAEERCFDEVIADADPATRRALAADVLRTYNEGFPYCR